MNIRLRNYLFFLGKLGFAGVLFYFLFRYKFINLYLLKNVIHQPVLALVALFCLFSGILLQGVRWNLLLDEVGIKLGLNLILKLTLIGSFFSSYLPGAAGGDAIRALYVYRVLNTGKGTAIVVLLIDRLLSLLGLLFVAAFIYLFLPQKMLHEAVLMAYGKIIFILLFGSFIAIFCGFVGISLVSESKLKEILPAWLARYIHPLLGVVKIYKRKILVLTSALILSVFASGIVVVGIVTLAAIFSFAPPCLVTAIGGIFGNLSSVIPLTPGGIGIGEAVFAKVCTDLTMVVAPYATIYFLFRLGMLIVNIPGMLIYLLFKIPPLLVEEMPSMEIKKELLLDKVY